MNNNTAFPFGFIDLQFTADNARIIKKMTLTAESVRESLLQIPYNASLYSKSKSAVVENAMFPPFALVFFRFIINHQKIPSADGFVLEVLNAYFNLTDGACVNRIQGFDPSQSYPAEDLKGRIYRTYPSLVRDFFFYLLCRESGKFDKVTYSLHNDYFKGVDLVVTLRNVSYPVSVYVSTKRGDLFKQAKYNRHEYSDNEIVLRLEMDKLQKVKDLYLPGQLQLNLLITEIEKKEHEKRQHT